VSMPGMTFPRIPEISVPISSSPDYGSLGASLGWPLQPAMRGGGTRAPEEDPYRMGSYNY
jgi:hypothetical protein